MFSITAKTCRRFSLREILIMAAMNVETNPPGIRRPRPICDGGKASLSSYRSSQSTVTVK
jgi:hypothetical protein